MGSQQDAFIHSGGPRLTGHLEDVEVLSSCGLVTIGYGPRGTPNFYVTPIGFKYYEHLKCRSTPAEAVEDEIRRHLFSDQFKQNHQRSFAKWSQAEHLLWSSESREQLTTIGHLCREAMQEFADELLQIYSVPGPHPPKDKTVARVQAAVAANRTTLGVSVAALLDALIPYWGTVAESDSTAGAWRATRR
jgi:hypothetical protein